MTIREKEIATSDSTHDPKMLFNGLKITLSFTESCHRSFPFFKQWSALWTSLNYRVKKEFFFRIDLDT